MYRTKLGNYFQYRKLQDESRKYRMSGSPTYFEELLQRRRIRIGKMWIIAMIKVRFLLCAEKCHRWLLPTCDSPEPLRQCLAVEISALAGNNCGGPILAS